MDGLFSNTFDQLGESIKAVLDDFSGKFSDSMNRIAEDFIAKFSETFAKLMEGFSQDFSNKLAESLGNELDSILTSGIFDEFLFQLDIALAELLSKVMLIASLPVILSLVAVVLSGLSLKKVKEVALFDKRIEIYSALEFLLDYNKIKTIKENTRIADKFEDNIQTLSKAKFVFDENLTKYINDFSTSIYDKITSVETMDDDNFIKEEMDNFKSNIFPQIESLVKI